MLGLSMRQHWQVDRSQLTSEKEFELRELKGGHLPTSQIFHALSVSDRKFYEPFYPCLWL